MRSTMMDEVLSVPKIFERGYTLHAEAPIGYYDDGTLTRSTFRKVGDEALRLASLLRALGLAHGDRVATFCWNRPEHLAAYFAVPLAGGILHTLNIRLFADQLAFIIDDADDRFLIVDGDLVPLLAPVLRQVNSVEKVIVIGTPESAVPEGPDIVDYRSAIADAEPLAEIARPAETDATAVCYTSGTTGNPKGVVYSHRSTFLHSLASLGADTFAISQNDRILLLPPMFHANAWGLPYSAWLAGAGLYLPGPHLQPAHVRRLIGEARPTFTAMVPTLVNDLLRDHAGKPIDMSSFRLIVSGGSAVSRALIERVRETWDVRLLQGWGMTETSPLCALSHPPFDAEPEDEAAWLAMSGRPVPGVEVRAVDDDGARIPCDGRTVGQLQLRGPWISGGYHGHPVASATTADGWLETGDVGAIDPRGYVRITDRTKDVIKSGGEWISSVDLENALSAHPHIEEVAVVGIADARWEERPLAMVVAAPDAKMDFGAIRGWLCERVARFWIPEYWSLLADMPRTSVGKIDKRQLREQLEHGEIRYERVDENGKE